MRASEVQTQGSLHLAAGDLDVAGGARAGRDGARRDRPDRALAGAGERPDARGLRRAVPATRRAQLGEPGAYGHGRAGRAERPDGRYDVRVRATRGTADGPWAEARGVTARAATTATRPQLSLKATTTLGLNVRSGPGTSHGRVGFIAGGSTTRYAIVGKNAATATWWQIQYSAAVKGWVYVQTHGSTARVAVTWTAPGPQLSLKATTTLGLNVRAGAGTNHRILGTIAGGSTTRYAIVGKNAATATRWQIQYSATVKGWVHADYVQTHGSTTNVPLR